MNMCECSVIDPKRSRLAFLANNGRVNTEQPCPRIPLRIREAYAVVAPDQIGAAQEFLDGDDWIEVARSVAHNAQCLQTEYMLGQIMLAMKEWREAERLLLRILEIEEHAAILHQLADICARDSHRRTEALAHSKRACELAPEEAWIYCAHGRSLIFVGRVKEGLRYMEQAMQMSPADPYLQTNCLWYRHYIQELDRGFFYQAYHDWSQRFVPVHLCRHDHLNSPEPQRKLRIGYISPDFYGHSVVYTFEPVLDGHDRSQVELFGYGNVTCPDKTTERLQAKFDCYRSVKGRHAEAIATQIRSDRIDILVALAGHCADNCLPVLAYKPAPIQVDVGSISTTGVEQIDYRITDEIYDPPETQAFYTEKLTYLSGGSISYRPPDESPLVGPLPFQSRGFITFGSFNHLVKISDDTLRLWCRTLRAVPDSRMQLKFLAGHDPGLQAYYRDCFARHGICPDRISITGELPFQQHLAVFNRVDILLDTYPFNGAITTLEGLWMGVPTLTLTGQTFVSRAGLAILKRLNLEVFAAQSEEEYIDKACSFAGQPGELAAIRHSLRPHMLDSPLCLPGRMARELESAYRRMWHTWCHDVVGTAC